MEKRYGYLFFLKPRYDKIKQTLPQYTEYWKTSDVKDYLGGTFADTSGEIISFSMIP